MQFYRIELAEQRRLRSVMEHHARESEVSAYAAAGQAYTLGEGGQGIIGAGARSPGVKTLPSTPVQGAFPFSITAGVEKGAKNRWVLLSLSSCLFRCHCVFFTVVYPTFLVHHCVIGVHPNNADHRLMPSIIRCDYFVRQSHSAKLLLVF
jgi:hypothetical protein